MRKLKLLFVGLCFLSVSSFCQIPTFDRDYGLFTDEEGESFTTESNNGCFWVVGFHLSTCSSTTRTTVKKIDGWGNLAHSFTLQNMVLCKGILPEEHGGCYLLGTSIDGSALLLMLDSAGNIQWSQILPYYPQTLAKYEANIFVTGGSNGILDYNMIDKNGLVLSSFSDLNSSAFISSMIETSDNDILCAVFKSEYDSAWYSFRDKLYLRKIDTLGNIIFDRLLSDSIWNWQHAAIFSNKSNGDILVSGYQMPNVFLAQLNSLGDTMWTHDFSYPFSFGQDYISIAASLNDGTIYVAVTKNDSNNLIFLRVDTLGNLNNTWDYSLNPNVGYRNFDFKTTSNHGFILCGELMDYQWGYRPYVIRLDSTLHITLNSTSMQEQSLTNPFTVYPNPSNGNFIINGNFETGSQIQILDASGKIVFKKDVLDETTMLIQANTLEAGIYFCLIQFNGQIIGETKLIVE